MVFATVKAEFQKKSENLSATLSWKLQTVSASIDLMVWTAEHDDQGTMSKIIIQFLTISLLIGWEPTVSFWNQRNLQIS